MKSLLLAAGLGTRLLPLTVNKPKCLVEVNGVTMLDFWIRKLDNSDVEDLTVNLHHFHREVQSFLSNLTSRIKIIQKFEPILLGTAGTLLANFGDLKDDLLIIHCDNYSSIDLNDLINFHKSNNNFLTVALFEPDFEAKAGSGMVDLDDKNNVTAIYEKPKQSSLVWANAAIYIFSSELLNQLATNFSEAKDISTEIIPSLIDKISPYFIRDFHIDIGTFSGLNKAVQIRND
jgi:mannose-1-phosphate guanylyltransferase